MSHPPPPPPPYGYGYPPQPPYGYGYPPQPPPHWTPPPQIDPAVLRPSRLWYWLSPIPAVAGIAIAIVLLVGVIKQFDTDLDHFVAPARVSVRMDGGDEKGLYLQTAGTAGARRTERGALSCAVNDAGGREVDLHDGSGLNLTVGDDEYVEQLRFAAPADGTYVVRCTGPAGAPAAVGPHIAVRRFVGPVIGMIAAFVIGVALSAIIAIVTGVRRSNHKQRLQREAREAAAR